MGWPLLFRGPVRVHPEPDLQLLCRAMRLSLGDAYRLAEVLEAVAPPDSEEGRLASRLMAAIDAL